jgi:uncharacterized protein (DUF342 family)
MWKNVIQVSESRDRVTAKLNERYEEGLLLEPNLLHTHLLELSLEHLYVDSEAVRLFVESSKNATSPAFQGIDIAYQKNAQVEVVLGENNMLASMIVTGAYGGTPLQGKDLVECLKEASVTKGINKLALKKVLMVSQELRGGETFNQPVAQGKRPIEGSNARFIPLIDDINKRVLKPQKKAGTDKVDMRDLGELITVGVNEAVMKRIPAKPGIPGYSVCGDDIPPKPIQNEPLMVGKGTRISTKNVNVLISTQAGMPIIKPRTIEVEDALCLSQVDISTGHIKFKGSVIISGNVDPKMEVRATGAITVGGFVESAFLQASGDITVGKGIIGHNVTEGEEKSCQIISGGNVTANYAQFADISARGDINFVVYSMNNILECNGNLVVQGINNKQGVLSGGLAHVGGKVLCTQLGVEGDTATYITAFTKYVSIRTELDEKQEHYALLQDRKMKLVRREIELKKIPKSKRTAEEQQELDALDSTNKKELDQLQSQIDRLECAIQTQLQVNTVESTFQTHTRVTIEFNEDKVTTKNTHGPSVFAYNQTGIDFIPKLKEDDVIV